MGEFRMPSLGADMDVGTIIEWLVKPGDSVRRGQIMAVVDTAKAAIEIEAFQDGVVEEILVGPGVQVPVGTPLAMIGDGAGAGAGAGVGAGSGTGAGAGAQVEDVARARAAGSEAAAVGAKAGPKPADVAARTATVASGPGVDTDHPRAAPPVRHLAHQLGIDLDTIHGTGPDGRITHADLLHAAGATPDSRQESGASPSSDLPQVPAGRPELDANREGRLRVSPRARRIAAERGIDLAGVAGSGGSGSGGVGIVLGGDVERAADAAQRDSMIHVGSGASSPDDLHGSSSDGEPADAAPAERATAEAVAARGVGAEAPAAADSARVRPAAEPDAAAAKKDAMRTAIANLMSRSNAEIPHYHVSQTMDLGPALAWLRAHNADRPPAERLLPAVLFLRATVLAALAVPDLNGHWVDGALQPADRVDLGVAVATRGGGLVTPAIPDAGPLPIDDLMARLADLVRRARRGRLQRAEMAGASITVSSLGETGPDALYGVIFPPQVALVGVGGIVERPWAVDGMLTVRPTATVVLAADHRASDGRTAATFLAEFARALVHPEEL